MKKFILSLIVITAFFACKKDEVKQVVPKGDYENGVIVLNEGGYQKGNASTSFLKDDMITDGVFTSVTGLRLGDTAQSIGFNDDLAFIIVNGSNKIEVVNRYTFESIKTVDTDLMSPRYITFHKGKGYVTNWGDGTNPDDDFLTVIDLADYSTSKISVAEGPEKLVSLNNKLYVAHKGGYSQGNTVSVIDLDNNNELVKTLTVGDIPSGIVSTGGDVYVLSSGKPAWTQSETFGSIHKIDGTSNNVSTVKLFTKEHPNHFGFYDGSFYYLNGKTLETTADFSKINKTDLPTDFTALYGFSVYGGKMYAADALDYASKGKVYVYSIEGTLLKEYTAGVLPNGFYFNN